MVKNKKISFVAIGGIKVNNLGDLVKNGAKCFCLITETTQSKNIKEKIKELYRIINENRVV